VLTSSAKFVIWSIAALLLLVPIIGDIASLPVERGRGNG
jgi:hypothetical protein